MKKRKNFDGSYMILWPDNETIKTMGVYYPKDGQNKTFDSDGNLLPTITKYIDGWRVELQEGDESRFLAWYNAIEKACNDFLDSCKYFSVYSNSNWDTATNHAHALREKSLKKRSEVINELGNPNAACGNADYWFLCAPSMEILFHLDENCGITIFPN